MDSDKYCQNVSEILQEIIEECGEDFVLYTENNPKIFL